MRQTQLADALSLTRGQVSKLVAKGMPTDSIESAEEWRRRNLDPGKVVGHRMIRKPDARRRQSLENTNTDDGTGFDLSAERARLAHHQANLAALDEEVRRKSLIPAEQVRTKWQDMLAAFRARLLGMPTRIAASCVGLDEREIERAARELVHQALDELSRGDGVR